MKVLAVIAGLGTGGAETSMAAMAPYLADQGVALEVAYFHERSGARESLQVAGVPLFHVKARNPWARLWALTRLIRSRSPDVVHTMVFDADVIGRSAATITRVPVVSSIINEMYGPVQFAHAPSRWRLRAAQIIDVVTAQRVTRFHAITETVADVMRPRLRIGITPIDVIYRGRDPAKFKPLCQAERRAKRSSLGFDDDDDLILAIGRQEPQKGLGTLIRAFAHVASERPQARLLLAGREGTDTSHLTSLATSIGSGGVRFLGHRDDVAEMLGAADAFVFPSLWEGLGGSVIEAMAVECPIVCSDIPVLREIVTTDEGDVLAELCAPDDPNAFSQAISRVLEDRSSRVGHFLDLGRRRFERHFQIDDVSAQMADCYKLAARH
jgi:glycosyltransferase involved in cell wall biosynthesis